MYVQFPAQHTYVMPTMIFLTNWVKHKLLAAPALYFWHMGYLGVDMRPAESRIK
jgi:hypothetical protein